MNDTTFKAFGDEVVKIAFFQKVRNGFVNALREGWHGTPEQVAANQGNTWFGQGRQIKPGMGRLSRMGEEFTSLGGLTRVLPVGAKSMMLLGTGLMAREALKKQDPTGQERSRAERVTGLAGNTVGGLVGSALASKALPKSRFLAPILGGVAGGMVGEKAMTLPWRHSQRTNWQNAVQQQVPVPPEYYWPQGQPAPNPGVQG